MKNYALKILLHMFFSLNNWYKIEYIKFKMLIEGKLHSTVEQHEPLSKPKVNPVAPGFFFSY